MSDNTQPTDWTSMAVQAMEQQNQAEAVQAETESEVVGPHLSPAALVGLAAKLLFLVSVGYFLVDRYGLGHLIWLALVGWYMVWPTITPNQRNVFK